MSIIELTSEYYKKYLNLMNQFRPVDINMCENEFNTIYNNITKNGKIFIYKQEENIIGSITFIIEHKFIYNTSKVGHIEDLYVDKNSRKMGIGNKLLNHCKNYSKQINCYKLTLYCNKELVPFYEKNNFIISSTQMKLLN